MNRNALILIACGLMASLPGAFADSSTTVTSVKVAESGTAGPLKFSDDQLERMHSIKMKYEDSRAMHGIELHRLHRQIFEALDQSSVDKAGIQAIQDKINALDAQQSNERIQMMIDMHDVFTPDQRQIMHRHMLEHDMMRHDGPGPGGMGGFGGPGGGFGPHGGPGKPHPPAGGPKP